MTQVECKKAPPICKDCGAIANPENTMVAADYGCEGPDLHFCDRCKARGDHLMGLINKGIEDGKVTVDQVAKEIGKASSN